MSEDILLQKIDSINMLHVDDDPAQFEFVKVFLQSEDPTIKVTCVSQLEQVIDELSSGKYQCLVTDYNMPKMNGIELASKVREKYSIPIILYTGQGSEEVAEKAFLVGVDDYLRKEIDPSHYKVLAKRIRSVVEKKQVELLYDDVMRQTHFGVSIIVDNVVVYANKAAVELFKNYNINNIIGKNPLSVLQKNNEKTVLSLGDQEYAYNVTKDKTLNIAVSNRSIYYNGKNAILSIFWDNTEKQKLKNENKISQERFKSLIELSPDGIATFNSLGYMTFLNNAFSSLTGFEKDELLGHHLTSLKTIRKRDILKYMKSFALVLQGKNPPSLEFTYNKKSGVSGVGESHLGLIDVNGNKEMLLIARDITDRKKQETRYKKLFENSPNGIVEIDLDANILISNAAFSEMIGIKVDKLVGNNLYDITFFERTIIEKIKDTLSFVTNNKKMKTIEFTLVRNHDDLIWVEMNVAPIIFDQEILGCQLTIKDISKRMKDEEKNKRYYEQLEKLVERKTNEIINNERLVAAGKTASMIGHDIRSPLQIINNCTHLLKTKYSDPLLTQLENQIKYSVELLKRFEDQTKTDVIKLEYFSVSSLIERIAHSCNPPDNIKMIIQIAENIPLVQVDEFQISRVLKNIINNSIQAMPEGGTLLITSENKKDRLEINIVDSGIGISSENLKNIFEPFNSTKTTGIGLGLSFCKSIVEAHGGTLDIVSQKDEGTTVTIQLPLRANNVDLPVFATAENMTNTIQ